MRVSLNIFIALWLFFSLGSIEAKTIDREKFFSTCKTHMPSVTSGDRAKAIEDIFDYWERRGYEDRRALAYVLGTAFRETAGTLRPVREGLCETDACSISAVTKLLAKRGESGNYSEPDAYGRSYFGRGYVQLTHKKNYKKIGESLGWGNDLLENPSLALDHQKSIEILVEGMYHGLFTGRKLSDYFSMSTEDWIGARKIVSPRSKRAEVTAKHGRDFYSCLR